jgi:para-aminobenzoate synthetase component 1
MSVHGYSWVFSAPEPAEVFARLSQRPGCFWLDSSLPRTTDGRFSIMGCEPRWIFSADASGWRIERRGVTVEHGTGDALVKLEQVVRAHQVTPAADSEADLPFFGGAVGWFSYDLGRRFETFGDSAKADLDVPEIRLAWHDAAVVWDHAEGRSWLVGIDGERSARDATRELQQWLAEPPAEVGLRAGSPRTASDSSGVGAPRPHLDASLETATSDFSRGDYVAGVERIREAIGRGEVYQANLVQRFTCLHRDSPAATYLRLRALNPAPFAFYQDAGEWSVLSSSPERFIEVTPGRRIRTCPIKGTRPRGRAGEDDRAQSDALLGSAKERAELLMIVDLLRNDLGRVCEFGSVQVPRLHALETFATVHHLVGEVTGTLRTDVRLRELLRAVFPGGSISGAPKVSALRLIDRLEPHRRGLGMGALGYLGAHGRIDLSIAIRTILCRDGKAHFHVGAGIVADSDPAAEYEETLIKGRALFQALGAQEATP